jgi:hypothetical protein
MAPTVGEKTLVNETTHFQVFPRQTIRAAISILEAVVLQGVFDGEWQHINELIHEATALLKDFSKPWPLTVEHGSKLWQWIFDLVFSAKRILSNLTSMEELGYYLKPLADFYDSAVTLDANGVLLSAELISFQKQLGLYESFERVKGKKKTSKRKIWLDRHPISGLNGIAKQEFDCLVLASEWKSELFPPESARGKTWLECRDKMLANPSALVKEVVSINWDIDWPAVMVEESEKPRDEVKAESNVLPSSSGKPIILENALTLTSIRERQH